MKFLSIALITAVFLASAPLCLSQTASTFRVTALASDGKKSKEYKSDLNFGTESVKITSRKAGVLNKDFKYSDIVAADYSYSKKPLLSTGGAVAMAILTGLVVIPFLFVKKKSHWVTIRTADDYVVIRADRENYRQVISELEIKNVKVETIDEDKQKEK